MRKTPQLLQRSVAALASLALIWPSSAFAATSLYVNDDEYTEAASGSGTEGGTWNWAGPDGVLTLDGFQGDRIDAYGDLDVILIGANAFNYLETYGGSISITGEGDDASLTVGDGTWDTGVYEDSTIADFPNGTPRIEAQRGSSNIGPNADDSQSVTISNVDIQLDNAQIISRGPMTIVDSNIDGYAPVSPILVDCSGVQDSYPALTIDNSHVHVVNTDPSDSLDTSKTLRDWSNGAGGITIFSASQSDVVREILDSENLTDVYDLIDQFPDFVTAHNIETQEDLRSYYEGLADNDEKRFNLLVEQLFGTDSGQARIENGMFVFKNVEGDTRISVRFDSKDFTFLPMGTDNYVPDVLIDPIPEPEPTDEEPTPTPTPEPEPTPAPVEEQTTPEPEPEPEVVNPVDEAPAPEKPAPAAPAPSGPQLPKTDDASSSAPVAAMAAGGVSALLAGSVLLRRRPQE